MALQSSETGKALAQALLAHIVAKHGESQQAGRIDNRSVNEPAKPQLPQKINVVHSINMSKEAGKGKKDDAEEEKTEGEDSTSVISKIQAILDEAKKNKGK